MAEFIESLEYRLEAFDHSPSLENFSAASYPSHPKAVFWSFLLNAPARVSKADLTEAR